MQRADHPLLIQHCRPAVGPALTVSAIATLLAQVPGWSLADASAQAIERTFSFADFHATMAFVNALAFIAHREDHHPDLQVSYQRCTVHYRTHSVAGLSINDFICAARINALLD